jgi:hypothetical protein
LNWYFHYLKGPDIDHGQETSEPTSPAVQPTSQAVEPAAEPTSPAVQPTSQAVEPAAEPASDAVEPAAEAVEPATPQRLLVSSVDFGTPDRLHTSVPQQAQLSTSLQTSGNVHGQLFTPEEHRYVPPTDSPNQVNILIYFFNFL